MTKLKEKFLLVVSFLEGRQFPRRPKTKFLIEAKFDGEQLATDPVDHVETLEVNQELAWELDKKALHMHKLQRSCIKAMCYALTNGDDGVVASKELIGYIVLDVKSAPEGICKPKWYPLLQPKYPKSKPNLQINVYIESDEQSVQPNNAIENQLKQLSVNPLVSQSTSHISMRPPLNSILTKNTAGGSLNSLNNSFNDLTLNQIIATTNTNKQLKVSLIESEGFYLIGNANTTIPTQTYSLTITIAFARNLIRLFTDDAAYATTGRNFYFVYTLLNNQVSTKPFSDIIACQINGERSTIRLHASFNNLKAFFHQQGSLEISFCSDERVLGKCNLKWKRLLEDIDKEERLDEMIVLDELLKFEAILQGVSSSTTSGRRSPSPIIDMSPVIGVQITLSKENANEFHNLNVLSNTAANLNSIASHHQPKPILTSTTHIPTINDEPKTNTNNSHNLHHHHQQQIHEDQEQKKNAATKYNTGLFQNETTTITFEEKNQKPKEPSLSLKSNSGHSIGFSQHNHQQQEIAEMQLKAAYELQLWKEGREKEFEQELKKKEAKKFQSLAEAFKQHDIEREMLVQKKLKEYNELETVLKNSLNEVEQREKKLAQDETRLARIKTDLNHEYEQKLIEMREASKRVQEKADHQVSMQKNKCEMMEQELAKYKRQLNEMEKKMADKDAEFVRYKEKENTRPEVRLQSELNVLHLEKVELERKLEAMIKAKNHYKEQWTRALQEIALIKKKEEENAKAQLKKQQQELEHLRLRYLAAEENELVMKASSSREENLDKVRRQRLDSGGDNSTESSSSMGNHHNQHHQQFHQDLYKVEDTDLQEHINRLVDERDTLLRTGVYSNTDAIIIELDKRIRDCLKEAKSLENNNVNYKQLKQNL